MKKIILTVLMSMYLIQPLFGNVEDSWIKAVENCEARNFALAEIHFTEAINEMERSDDRTRAHIYVDRGRLFMLLGRYEEALHDLNIALDSSELTGQDRIRGLVSKIATCSNLELESNKEREELRELHVFPKMEILEDKIIIRNAPDCTCYKDMVTNYFINSGLCESENDIKIMKSGSYIIKSKKCPCTKKKPLSSKLHKTQRFLPSKKIEAASELLDADHAQTFLPDIPTSLKSYKATTAIEDCKEWCSRVAKLGDVWCGKSFKSIKCQIACLGAVEVINSGCHWCCSTGDFRGKCIEPFNDILAKMDSKICQPDWD